ncbi:hypothetical protein [Maricaulis salignorans]|uniref:Uncharacterized protein n=1 Tax=Maricaulis salignorans TaxID=144026 RepID=A0A1G9LJB3_9PROT|nr:hypothetical protein [Maricaulis salignorans]SDL61928.1 hypothetical protein SAMN04488568_10176 [Maricaulis salignorans]
MRSGFLGFLLMAGFAAPVQAQAPRDVLLEVCNQTGFAVAAAAAYRTTPAPSRTLRSWFMIAPGECLNGALNGVVGEDLDLHVMSGSWVWPARETAQTYCVPADATLTLASVPPCSANRRARDFTRLPVEATSRRGPGGRNFGRVVHRIHCEDLGAADAGLCPGAPVDPRGMAAFVRELEVCNNGRGPVPVSAGQVTTSGGLEFQPWQALAAGECRVIYRGFPRDGQVLLAPGPDSLAGGGLVCMTDNADGPVFAAPRAGRSEACPQERPLPGSYETVVFGAQTGRMTMFAGQ